MITNPHTHIHTPRISWSQIIPPTSKHNLRPASISEKGSPFCSWGTTATACMAWRRAGCYLAVQPRRTGKSTEIVIQFLSSGDMVSHVNTYIYLHMKPPLNNACTSLSTKLRSSEHRWQVQGLLTWRIEHSRCSRFPRIFGLKTLGR